MENKKVSILVPVYGVEKYIERCARSLFEQTYDNIEYIFVDDCTKDHSIDILQKVLEEYPNRKAQVKILHHEKNRGLSAARNTALDASTGDYLMHVDSDDYVSVNLIIECIDSMSRSSADIVVFGFYKVYSDIEIRQNQPDNINIEEYQQGVVSGRYCHTLWSGLVKREIYEKNKIRSIEGLHQGEDYAVMTKLVLSTNKICIISKPMYYYVMRNSILKFNKKNVDDTIVAYKNIKSFLQAKGIYGRYKESLRVYTQLLLCWLLNTCSTIEDYKYIDSFIGNGFPKYTNYSGLSTRHKIAIKIFSMHRYYLLKKYFMLFNYAQKMMKRVGTNLK